jgi:hypothetical protein
LGQVAEAECLPDLPDLRDRIFATVLPEHPPLDVLEFFAHLVNLPRRQRRVPGREEDRVRARRMVALHQDEGFDGAGGRLGMGGADRAIAVSGSV